jgi:hypothetical protein
VNKTHHVSKKTKNKKKHKEDLYPLKPPLNIKINLLKEKSKMPFIHKNKLKLIKMNKINLNYSIYNLALKKIIISIKEDL